jgi:hypothetical protein
MKNLGLFKQITESKKYQIKDFPIDSLVTFKDGETWKVIKAGMRSSNDRVKSDEITIKPFDEVAKRKNVSLPIDVNLDYLNANVTKIVNESEVNEAKEYTFSINYNTDEDDVEYIQNILMNAGVDAIAEPGIDSEEMIIKALNAVELRKAKKAIQADGFEINEGRSQIKRKYGEHGAIRVNNEAPIRNSILEFLGKRFVTRDEMNSHLTQLSEDRGKAVDQTKWFKRNERYFESFNNRGQEILTLSKYGKRVLENILKAKQEKQENTMIKESIGLFKFNLVNESIDVKYWSDYNDEGGRTFAAKEFAEKSKDFDETFEEAVDDWNDEAEDAENRIKGAQIKKIEKLAKEFFKKAGWISINVVQAMIMQES